MIRTLWIESFKAFSDDPRRTAPGIPLQPFTVLVGPNGSGKSTILQTIDTLGWLSAGTIKEMLDAHNWEYADLAHLRAERSPISLRAEIDLPNAAQVQWHLTLGSRRAPGVASEWIKRAEEDEWRSILLRSGRTVAKFPELADASEETTTLSLPSSWLSTIDLKDDRDRFPTLVALAQWARRIRAYYFLDPVALRAPSRGKGEKLDELGLHGENLASFLGRIKSRPKDFARLIERVRAHYPRLVDIQVRRKSYGWTHIEITEKWNGEQATFNARQVSDGLLRLIAVAAMHEMREAPSVLLIDEIENGLHPRLLGGLVAMLEELTRTGVTQVIATTHSPITLNYVSSPESVLLVTRGKGGGVQVTPMNETKSFQELREHFELGELWYNAGEERLVPGKKGR
ncbi:AAA family ATPase [Sorangium sp. So ce1000]|uniref:AAA family ATPase n=1 Tax=Sorangium sp. So ce1000 TaxID=3133325 RepID=UPI003F5FF5A3